MKHATLQTDGSWKLEEFTSEETTAYNNEVAADKTMRDAETAAAIKKENDKALGKAKLKDLGLTDDQIAALVG
mgnify:CR=1 FL=1|tara:strand:+ start:1096 stop:1314 length:219 start_codon:yes stop_codon:yes gene_type:complete